MVRRSTIVLGSTGRARFVKRRRIGWLVAGAAVAVVTAAAAREDTPKVEVPDRPLAGTLSAASQTPSATPTAAPPTPTRMAARLVGDAALAGALDLDAIEQVGERYEAKLADGRRAVLTLDPAYQEAAAYVLRESRAPRGAVVILDPDGRVLALAGRRATKPTGSTDGTPDAKLATDVWAPAASIFKLVTAAALVDAGVKPDQRVCYHGGVRSVMESNLVDNKSDNRCEDLTYAVAHSQNAIIAKLVHQSLEPDALRQAAIKLGVHGDTPAWALAGPAGMVEPPPQKGVDFGKCAAGFSGSQMSTVGAALLASTIGNHGKVAPPRVVDTVIDHERTIPVAALPPRQAVSAEIADRVADMMIATCVRGSAARSFRGWKGGRIAGKTGTLAQDQPFYQEFSWFVGFVETDRGAVAIAVALGNAESWWMKAHTAARRILDRASKPTK